MTTKKELRKMLSDAVNLKSESGNFIAGLTNPKTVKSVMTGYSEIDDHIGGFKPGQFVLVASEAKFGKTITLINLICGMIKDKANVLVFNSEVPQQQYIDLCMSCLSKVPYAALEQHKLSPEELQKLEQVAHNLKNNYGELTIVHTSQKYTPNDIQKELNKIQSKQGIKYDVVVVDDVYMIRSDMSSTADYIDQARISVEELKDIARKNNVTVLAAVLQTVENDYNDYDVDEDEDDVDEESTGISYGWYQTADVIFTIQDDKPYSSNIPTLRFNVQSRHSPEDSFELVTDFNRTTLKSIRDNPVFKDLWNKLKLG